MKKLVALVGKPNVGKSTLFNKLIAARLAIVDDVPGTTRDRLYHEALWVGRQFTLIDTGGISLDDRIAFQKQIEVQAQIAIEEADVIVFVVDGRTALTSEDLLVASMLRKSQKPLLVAANKLEGNREFDTSVYQLGIEPIFAISAMHGEGVGNLLDALVAELGPEEKSLATNPRLAIIGQPNVGKSSLFNALLGEARSIVSPTPNTTRDALDAEVMLDQSAYTIVDTAGINRKSKLVASVDHYALGRALHAIEQSDVVLIVLDATKEPTHFDAVVSGNVYEANKPAVIVVNKWDLIVKETNTMRDLEARIRRNLKFLAWTPMVFVSATKPLRLEMLAAKVNQVMINAKQRLRTRVINEVVTELQMVQPAPSVKGGRLQITFGKQIIAPIPTFTLFVNNVNYTHFSYTRYIENELRKTFDFEGTPIRLLFRNRKGDKV